MSEKQYLFDKIFECWKGQRVVVGIGSEISFLGIFEDFDEEVILFKNVIDYVGNKVREFIVKIDDMNWIMFL